LIDISMYSAGIYIICIGNKSYKIIRNWMWHIEGSSFDINGHCRAFEAFVFLGIFV
jgi:hypothetical protein